MDNAAKAIIMAGGVLIGVLLISMFFYMLTTFRDFQRNMDSMKVTQEVLRFNNRFEPYITPQSGDSIKGWQVYNLLGIAIDENANTDGMFDIKISWGSSTYSTDRVTLEGYRSNFFYTEHLADNYSVVIPSNGYGPNGEIEKIIINFLSAHS